MTLNFNRSGDTRGTYLTACPRVHRSFPSRARNNYRFTRVARARRFRNMTHGRTRQISGDADQFRVTSYWTFPRADLNPIFGDALNRGRVSRRTQISRFPNTGGGVVVVRPTRLTFARTALRCCCCCSRLWRTLPRNSIHFVANNSPPLVH